ncbi:MAG: hypothetical protein ACR2OF_07210 [Hyphomicrobium sp.]
MPGLFYYGVKVRWNDARTEMFRYDTEEQALNAEHYQLVENWRETKSATYVGKRIYWRGLLNVLLGPRC